MLGLNLIRVSKRRPWWRIWASMNKVINGSAIDFSPALHQGVTWPTTDNFYWPFRNKLLNKYIKLIPQKLRLKGSSAKCRPFCPWANKIKGPRVNNSGRATLNTLRPRQNGRRFTDDTFKRIFLNENVRISIKISLKFVPGGPINNNPALVQIMAWRRSGDKPLSEPMMVSLLTHICVTRPQWVKWVKYDTSRLTAGSWVGTLSRLYNYDTLNLSARWMKEQWFFLESYQYEACQFIECRVLLNIREKKIKKNKHPPVHNTGRHANSKHQFVIRGQHRKSWG